MHVSEFYLLCSTCMFQYCLLKRLVIIPQLSSEFHRRWQHLHAVTDWRLKLCIYMHHMYSICTAQCPVRDSMQVLAAEILYTSDEGQISAMKRLRM